jgi:hypothetical protein
MIRATKGIVAVVCLLSDCRVVNGLLDEDIVKDASLAKRECRCFGSYKRIFPS